MKTQRKMIDFASKTDVQELSQQLKCPEQIVRYCGTVVGPSKTAIECYLSMNREWLLKFKIAG
jgi:hypothetical protein